MARGSGDTCTCDAENRLLSSSGGASYTCASTGGRATTTSGTTTTDNVYDSPSGSNLLATYTSSGTQIARYLDANAVNSPVEVYEGGNHYAYQTDALGSVRMVTGGSQNATDTYAYDAWGNPTSQSGTLANPFEYTGSIYAPDVNSNGYYDDRARFYDPSADGGHRFLSGDPLGGGYAYAGNSPLNFVDPTGMAKKSGGGGPPGSPVAPASNPLFAYLDRCAAEATVFVLGVVLSVLGAYFMYSMLEANAILEIEAGVTAAEGGGVAAGGSLALDIGAVVEHWNDPWAVAGAIIDILSWVFWTLVIPNAGWWQDIVMTAQFGGELTPVGWAVLAASIIASAAIGYIALSNAGCGF